MANCVIACMKGACSVVDDASRFTLLVTCEHGGNRIPAAYRALFARHARLLNSHRGYDPGALELAKLFASQFGGPLFFATVSRLLVELNRSPHHPALFSIVTRSLSRADRMEVVKRYYTPYRHRVERAIALRLRRRRRVLHLSVHSFTPVLDGVVRRADLGLLYDPQRRQEAAFCRRWQQKLRQSLPALLVRRNYPYRGAADGLTTSLRKRFPAQRYIGIELEVNQRFPLSDPAGWKHLQRVLAATLRLAL